MTEEERRHYNHERWVDAMLAVRELFTGEVTA